jgi:hypothetical protein
MIGGVAMKSIYQKDIGIGTAKNYPNGVVGLQIKNTSHDVYKSAMKPLRGIDPRSNDLISKHFGPKR